MNQVRSIGIHQIDFPVPIAVCLESDLFAITMAKEALRIISASATHRKTSFVRDFTY